MWERWSGTNNIDGEAVVSISKLKKGLPAVFQQYPLQSHRYYFFLPLPRHS
jgi:hypothetical protein